MKILTADQIRELDRYTIEHGNISSHDLMERAAIACCDWIENNYQKETAIWIFCGPGNNGGDGLAIARILYKSGIQVKVWTLYSEKKSPDFLTNEKLLKEADSTVIQEVKSENDFPFIPANVLIIDALFGTGLSKPVFELASILINYMNDSAAEILAIDLPSGLFTDVLPKPGQTIIRAEHTLSFQLPKFSFLFPASDEFVGNWHILEIGLNQKHIDSLPTDLHYSSIREMKDLLKPRGKFSHKGTYGHAFLISGSKGKMGAAILAAAACVRSGVGLLTVHVPESGLGIIQTSVPEAMAIADESADLITSVSSLEGYSAVGIGPGTGTDPRFTKVLEHVMKNARCPLVLDADALNCLAQNPSLMEMLPENSILTPHIKEFERLAGKSNCDADRHQLQKEFSKKYNVFIILKGAHSCISSPDGRVYFNSTGNSGMAKGGTGDALTGILLGLLAQGYPPLDAAQLGVFLHGLAGDIAKEEFTEYAMTAMDLIHSLPKAFKKLDRDF